MRRSEVVSRIAQRAAEITGEFGRTCSIGFGVHRQSSQFSFSGREFGG
ncbi:MAG: hypothetical protein ABJC09_13655 [Terriglobia bacterium]